MARPKEGPRERPGEARGWPGWAQGLVSVLILFHLVAIGAGAMTEVPTSDLLMSIAQTFRSYYGLVDMGYAYRFYAPEPNHQPVVDVGLEFADGTRETFRLPDRSLQPGLRYQRSLALANWLYIDYTAAFQGADHPADRLARAYARHLCHVYQARGRPCERVTVWMKIHRIADLERVQQARAQPDGEPFDPDAAEFSTRPVPIGEYSCDESDDS